jgi:two-component system response regulator FixJ
MMRRVKVWSSDHDPESLPLLARYSLALAAFLAALAIRFALTPLINGRPLLVLFVSAVLLTAIFVGLGPAIFATGLVLTYDAILKIRSDHLQPADVINTLAFCLIVVEIYWVGDWWKRARRSAESKLVEQQESLDHLLNALPDGVIVTDKEGKILSRNRAGESILGIPLGSLGDRNIFEFLTHLRGPAGFNEPLDVSHLLRRRESTVVLQQDGTTIVPMAVHVQEVHEPDRSSVLVWSIRSLIQIDEHSLRSDAARTIAQNDGEIEEAAVVEAAAAAPIVPADEIAAIRSRYEHVSGRERQVLDELIAGKSNREIGDALNISPRTVERHRANVMDKMKAKSFSDLVQMALKLRLSNQDEASSGTVSGPKVLSSPSTLP